MAGHDEAPGDAVDSSLPQMSDVVPADGFLFRPSHARQQSNNPNVFADDYSIDSIDAPMFSNHQRTLSFSSINSTSTVELRHHNPIPKAVIENDARTSMHDQQQNRQSVISSQQQEVPEESSSSDRTLGHHSEPSATSNEEISVDPFADEPTSSTAGAARPSSIRKGVTTLNRQSTNSTVSASSSYVPVPRPMSPYRGSTGPSHPYAMYPQVGVSRTPSVATVSTIRQVDSPLRGRTAPQHPYAMYPQNIDYEEDLGDQPIPVGFPAHGLQPQQGTAPQADEVGDIVGPDGHLEQLPPYSRYPDGVVRPTTSRGSASLVSGEGYQNETRNQSDLSSGTLVDVNSSEPLQPSSSEQPSPKAAAGLVGNLREKGRQKCCGAPLSVVVLLSLAMVVCVLLGAVIGGVLGERAAIRRAENEHSSQTAQVVTVTYTSDVSPYTSVPTGVAALPTGNYQVPWMVTNASKFCVGSPNQTQAWSCQVMDPLAIAIQGSVTSGSLTVQQPNIVDGRFDYGAQLPYDITPPTQQLTIMLDKEDPDLGPALFFQTMFNKLVIIQNSDDMPSIKKRDDSINKYQGRNSSVDHEHFHDHHDHDDDDDDHDDEHDDDDDDGNANARPWFCWWNQTQIETFIYINQTQNISGIPTQPVTGSTTQTISNAINPAATGTGLLKRDFDIRDFIVGIYPRTIKIKENRVNPNAPQAYCQQMQVNANNTITPIPGQRFNINETIPGSQQNPNPCYCEWMT